MSFATISMMVNFLTSTMLGLVLTSTPLFLIGTYWLKRFADEGTILTAAMAALFYTAANYFYARLISASLSEGYLASSISVCLSTMLMSVFVFGEVFDARKFFALIALIAAGVVLSMPSPGKSIPPTSTEKT